MFRFTMSGDLEDYIALCAVLRAGAAVDDPVLAALSAKLKSSTGELATAIAAQATPATDTTKDQTT